MLCQHTNRLSIQTIEAESQKPLDKVSQRMLNVIMIDMLTFTAINADEQLQQQ